MGVSSSLPSASASPPPPSEAFVKDFQQCVVHSPPADPLHLDASRTDFLRDTALTLHRIVYRPPNSRADSANGFRRLLLGRKGVGKTCLLTNMQRAAKEMLRQHGLLCLYFNYEEVDKSPLELIRNDLSKHHGLTVPQHVETAGELCHWLAEQGRVLFLVMDEFQLVFTERLEPDVAKKTICEVMSIGSSPLGRIHCILSGSSPYLRRLCFSKIEKTEADKHGFVHYHKGIDMNSTKFSAKWIYPFSDAGDFREVTQMLCPGRDKEELKLYDLYLRTGGNPRFIDEWRTSSSHPPRDTYSLGLRHNLSPAELSVLRYLREQLSLRLSNQPLPDSEGEWDDDKQTPDAAFAFFKRLTTYTQLMQIDVSTLTADLNQKYQKALPDSSAAQPLPPNWPAILYDLADGGYLRYEMSSDSMEPSQIGFASARVYFDLLQREPPDSFSLVHFCALLHPVHPFDQMAEYSVMQCLKTRAPELFYSGASASESAFGQMSQMGVMSFSLNSPSNSAQPSPRCTSPIPSAFGTGIVLPTLDYPSCSLETLCSGVWKEGWCNSRDVLGADIVLFELKEDKHEGDKLLAHRVQVKLGHGPSKNSDWVEKAAERFQTMLPQAQQAYARNDVKVELRNYLLTTRQHNPTVLEKPPCKIFSAVFNAKDLKQRLWPKEIQDLGKPYGGR